MRASASCHPNSAPSVGQGQDHQESLDATPPPVRPTNHAHFDSGIKRTHPCTGTYHDKTHTVSGTGADAHSHQKEGGTPYSNTNPVHLLDTMMEAGCTSLVPPPTTDMASTKAHLSYPVQTRAPRMTLTHASF